MDIVEKAATITDGKDDVRLLSVNVYRNGSRDCTNGGSTAFIDSVFIICPEGPYKASEVLENQIKPTILALQDRPYGSIAASEVVLNFEDDEGLAIGFKQCPGRSGPMFGGNFVYSSDSRFTRNVSRYPVPVHDRWE